jgi:hypothetical protein
LLLVDVLLQELHRGFHLVLDRSLQNTATNGKINNSSWRKSKLHVKPMACRHEDGIIHGDSWDDLYESLTLESWRRSSGIVVHPFNVNRSPWTYSLTACTNSNPNLEWLYDHSLGKF